MSQIQNFEADQGSSFEATISVKNEDGTPFNLTDYAVDAKIAKAAGSEFIITMGASIVNPATDGVIKVAITPENMAKLGPGNWAYDIKIINTSEDDTRTVLRGTFSVIGAVTK
jgi:hypothetical protein